MCAMRSFKRRKQNRRTGSLMRLDSLVDIVSNSIGILIILVAFIALLTFKQDAVTQAQPAKKNRPLHPPVPQSHPVFKNRLLFYISQQKIRWIDLRPLYLEIAKARGQLAFQPFEYREPGMRLRFFPISNHSHCLEATVASNQGEPWHVAWRANSTFQNVLSHYLPEEFYAFFWVEANSFATFYQVRKMLQETQYEVGWQPVLPKQALEICSHLDTDIDFAPQ